jgi:nucleotide-binding universal stress UspA family protein
MGFSNILVGLDIGATGTSLTPGSKRAFAEAKEVASKCGASLTIYHSTLHDEHWDPDEGHFIHTAPEVLESGILSDLESELNASGVVTNVVQTEEPVAVAMIRLVKQNGHDLVIVGKRSHTEVEFGRLGSVSRKLLHKCPCPVWAVKEGARDKLDHVIGATDFQVCSDKVLKTTFDVAAIWGATAHLVHAFQIDIATQMHGDPEAFVVEKKEEYTARLTESAKNANCENFTCHVAASSPSNMISKGVQHLNADLVVIGSVSREGLPGMLLGNTAERLLERLDVSMLVVKPDSFFSPVEQATP